MAERGLPATIGTEVQANSARLTTPLRKITATGLACTDWAASQDAFA